MFLTLETGAEKNNYGSNSSATVAKIIAATPPPKTAAAAAVTTFGKPSSPYFPAGFFDPVQGIPELVQYLVHVDVVAAAPDFAPVLPAVFALALPIV